MTMKRVEATDDNNNNSIVGKNFSERESANNSSNLHSSSLHQTPPNHETTHRSPQQQQQQQQQPASRMQLTSQPLYPLPGQHYGNLHSGPYLRASGAPSSSGADTGTSTFSTSTGVSHNIADATSMHHSTPANDLSVPETMPYSTGHNIISATAAAAAASVYPIRPQREQIISSMPSQQQQQQQQPQNQQHLLQTRLSPTARSSPIAIIHNPEDAANQAKLRYQHPMYDDTSDEELEDSDDFYYLQSSGVSIESLTSPTARTARLGGPQSLPTALLRAPKLGSLPSHRHDYRLMHLASLPPPMCLNGEIDVPDSHSTILSTDNNNNQDVRLIGSLSAQKQSTTARKPKYLSSYGSLRESHLTGRFGGAAASKRTLLNAERHQKVRFHHYSGSDPPPALSLPPRPPPQQQQQQKKTEAVPPKLQQVQAPEKLLSIRDRMMQRAHHKESQSSGSDSASETVKSGATTSSLSAMLEATDLNAAAAANQPVQSNNDATGSGTSSEANNFQPKAPPNLSLAATSSGVPAGMANAVAISYKSNVALFARIRQQEQERREAEQRIISNDYPYVEPSSSNSSSEGMLSTSMTGLEILRSASRRTSAPLRPTSLNILQDSPTLMVRPPPPETTNLATSHTANVRQFTYLSRTMSEPNPHWEQQQQQPSRPGMALTLGAADALPSPTLAQEASSTYNIPTTGHDISSYNGVRTMDERTLPAPPPAMMQQPMTGLSTLMTQQQSHPQQAMTAKQALSNQQQAYGFNAAAAAAEEGEEDNPDTEEAFDMDME